MTHLTPEELERWWAHGEGDRDRISAHLGLCDECVARYRQLVDPPPLEAVSTTAPARLIRAGYRAYRDDRPWVLRAVLARPFQAAAGLAAALVLLAVFVPGPWRPGREMPDADAIRGTRIQLLAPAGTVSPPLEFRWASPVGAAFFRLEIYETAHVDGEPVFTLESTDERLALPDASRRRLRAGASYSWRVTAVNAQGRTISQSRLTSFVVSASEP